MLHLHLQKFFQSAALLFFAIALLSVPNVRADEDLARREWKIEGVTREALVHIPADAKNKSTPVVFAFHGHGGTMERAVAMFGYHQIWPEAIVVYMQGLNTPGRLTDHEGKAPGWQFRVGDHDDRDLKFFDAVLASLKQDYKVDAKRVYCGGHSNGGSFSYLLWFARPNDLAAIAPSGAAVPEIVEIANAIKTRAQKKSEPTLHPKPVFHIAGENDPLVKYEWQKQMIDMMLNLNQCGAGKPSPDDKLAAIYESKIGMPVITYIHQGQHNFPRKAPAQIVKFFQSCSSEKQKK